MHARGRGQYRFSEEPIRELTIIELPHEANWDEGAITSGLAVIIVEVTRIPVVLNSGRSTA
jgi:hypothetical protein